MWLVFGNRTRARRVPDGRTVERACEDCGAVRRFVECDVQDRVNVFFVEVAQLTSRRLVCEHCGHDVELTVPTAKATPAAPARPAVGEKDVDAKLRELKKKMGL
ncbi:MAG: hypothetical protein AB2A00_38335 [Myxococcota bacterium]